MTDFAPYGGGYDTGHCWYYRLGGRILSVAEIKDNARGEDAHAHFVSSYAKIDRMKEPERSAEITSQITSIERSMKRDADRYLDFVKEIEHLRTFIGPQPYDWAKETYNEPHTGISLKHNHISYGAAQIRALKSMQVQGDLFG